MYKITEQVNNEIKTEELFLNLYDTIEYLEDFLEKYELDFDNVETLEELEEILENLNSNWYKLQIEEVEEDDFLGNFGKYDLRQYGNYIIINHHETVDKIAYDEIINLSDKDLEWLLYNIDEYNKSDDNNVCEAIKSCIIDNLLNMIK